MKTFQGARAELYGGIEAGGTKFLCAISRGDGSLLVRERIPTTTPEETLGRVVDFFQGQWEVVGALRSIGIASFGPIDLSPGSPTYGFITSTPKKLWAHTDLAGVIERRFGVPVGFDTDVNGAALGELSWGAGQGFHTLLYVTVGTGIGGGVAVLGEPLHGRMHPELGHVLIPRDLDDRDFPGNCPFHGDCVEGLASGPAIKSRWGRDAAELPADHEAWALEAAYLGRAVVNYLLTLSPQLVIMGGGVMQQQQLFPMIREEVRTRLNGYIQAPPVPDDLGAFIVPPGTGNLAGILGAIELAKRAWRSKAESLEG